MLTSLYYGAVKADEDSLSQEYAGLGGDANFVKAESESSISRPLGFGHVSRCLV